MKKNILIGFLILIIIFFVPIWLTNKLHRINTDVAVTAHGESIIFINRKFKNMQADIARLTESNDKLKNRLKEYEAIHETFKKIVKEKFPKFIKEGKENGINWDA